MSEPVACFSKIRNTHKHALFYIMRSPKAHLVVGFRASRGWARLGITKIIEI